MTWDPLTNALYKVELEGLGELVFTECSGLKNSTEVVELWEGGENSHVHKLIGPTKSENLVLKHGMGKSTKALYRLRESVIFSRQRSTFDGAVVLLDDTHRERWRWPFKNAFISRWEGPVLKGQGNTIAVETLEIVCSLPSPKAPAIPRPTRRPPPEVDWIVADFDPDPAEGMEGVEVQFRDKSTCSHAISEWEWRCPANRNWKSSEQSPSAGFPKAGTYTVSLLVTSSTGKTAQTARLVKVLEDFVEAEFDPADAVVLVGEEVAFTDKSEASSKITSWEWQCRNIEWRSTDQSPKAKFDKPGLHPVVLKVTSETGKSDVARHKVKVVPDCPQWKVRFTFEQSKNPNLPNQYTFELPRKGPNGENLAFIDWDFGEALDKLGTRRVHQKRKHVANFPKKGETYTITCGVRLQGYETCWYKMEASLTAGQSRTGHSSWAVVEPYEAPEGTLKHRL